MPKCGFTTFGYDSDDWKEIEAEIEAELRLNGG